MINSISIRNFQSHKRTSIKFDKGITIITGQSDRGKSAVIRALYWLIFNKPGGKAFCSNWGGITKIILSIDKNIFISRKKHVDKNNYSEIIDGKEQMFHSFGQNVPEKIKDLLNFSSLNIAEQFESPFLLALSGGEVAKYLNKIVNLDKIDLSFSNINKLLREEQASLLNQTTTSQALKDELNSFDWIEEAEGCLAKLELFYNKILVKKNEAKELVFLLQKIKTYGEELKIVSFITKYENKVNELLQKEKDLQILINNRKQLVDLKNDLEIIDADIKSTEINLENWTVEFKEKMPDVCPLCGKE
ncbi:MAG: AAA family ATPase [Gammaproteobacteria bacterium]|nr:AAA family ATPase [Gammaproteobacteria bacterium]